MRWEMSAYQAGRHTRIQAFPNGARQASAVAPVAPHTLYRLACRPYGSVSASDRARWEFAHHWAALKGPDQGFWGLALPGCPFRRKFPPWSGLLAGGICPSDWRAAADPWSCGSDGTTFWGAGPARLIWGGAVAVVLREAAFPSHFPLAMASRSRWDKVPSCVAWPRRAAMPSSKCLTPTWMVSMAWTQSTATRMNCEGEVNGFTSTGGFTWPAPSPAG